MDALVSNWSDGIPTAFDITVTSPLTPVSLQEASVTRGTAALLAERRKHQANDPVGLALHVFVNFVECWISVYL